MLSNEVHADRLHDAPAAEKEAANQRHAEINAAYRSLSSLKERLAHLVEIETGQPPRRVEAVPADIADRFIEASSIGGEADRLLARAAESRSRIGKVELVAAALDLGDRVENLLNQLNDLLRRVESELRSMNTAWESAPAIAAPERRKHLPLDRLEECYRRAAYLETCSRQLRERATKLSIFCASS